MDTSSRLHYRKDQNFSRHPCNHHFNLRFYSHLRAPERLYNFYPPMPSPISKKKELRPDLLNFSPQFVFSSLAFGVVDMELWLAVCGGLAALLMAAWAVRMLNWAFWKPRCLERALRSQGLKGSSYRPIRGDLKEMVRLTKEARGKPMPFSHAIFPRVSPFFRRAAEAHGQQPYNSIASLLHFPKQYNSCRLNWIDKFSFRKGEQGNFPLDGT